MKQTAFYLCVFPLLLLWSCNRSDDQLDCPGQSDRAVDVIGGPLFPSYGGETTRAFLSNEYGGRGEIQEVVGYPMHLNWFDGCQDEYTVNILSHYPARWDGLVWPSQIPEYAGIHSYFGVKNGDGFNLGDGPPSGLSFDLWEVPSRSLEITGIPAWDELIVLPNSRDFDLDELYPTGQGTLHADLQSTTLSSRTVYIIFKLAGTLEYRGIRLNYDDPSWDYDFATAAIPFAQHQIEIDEGIDRMTVFQFSDDELNEYFSLGGSRQGERTLSVLLPPEEGPFTIGCSSSEAGVSRRTSKMLPELPLSVDLSIHGADPILDISWTEDFLNLEMELPGYCNLWSGTWHGNEPYIVSVRRMEGPLNSGQNSIRIPDLPPPFRQQFPAVQWLPDMLDYGFKITFWHYPAIQLTEDYRHLDQFAPSELIEFHSFEFEF